MVKTLEIYNSLSRTKETFRPIDPERVRIYVCGMTVYDYCHIGHARVLVVFDMVVRYLRSLGYQVTYVRNITDIDDKIIARAHEQGESIQSLTARFIAAMHEDAGAIGVQPPDEEPRATASMADIIAMIGRLEEKGYAYRADNGDVYYRVSRFSGYGKLSGKHLEDLRAGERVEVDAAKEDPLDFVLWKSAKPGEPSWESSWGPGRPGWHIECSAMSTHCLGDHFDIHGGGMDLMFPHHENEIAQSEAATGHKFVNYWMHNGFVQINEEKMSKSLGNFFTVREVLARYQPEVVRYFILASHYRSPLNYSTDNLDSAKSALDRFYTALRDVPATHVAEQALDDSDYARQFRAAMNDDFNTPEALAVLFDLARDLNRAKSEQHPDKASRLAGELKHHGAVLGLLQDDPEAYLKGKRVAGGPGEAKTTGSAGELAAGLSDEAIDALIAQRIAAREAKNWAESDRIRDELKAQGIVLEDRPDGSTDWRRG